MRRGPSPISKRIRIINNKFRELWDKNLLKYNLTGVQMEILCYLKCNPDKEIHQREIEYWFQLKNGWRKKAISPGGAIRLTADTGSLK